MSIIAWDGWGAPPFMDTPGCDSVGSELLESGDGSEPTVRTASKIGEHPGWGVLTHNHFKILGDLGASDQMASMWVSSYLALGQEPSATVRMLKSIWRPQTSSYFMLDNTI